MSKKKMVARLVENMPGSIAGTPARAASSPDGAKYLLAGDLWLLIRPGGTEPMLRVYAGSSDPMMVDALLGYGESVADAWRIPAAPAQASVRGTLGKNASQVTLRRGVGVL